MADSALPLVVSIVKRQPYVKVAVDGIWRGAEPHGKAAACAWSVLITAVQRTIRLFVFIDVGALFVGITADVEQFPWTRFQIPDQVWGGDMLQFGV